jgi:hypothetical protein
MNAIKHPKTTALVAMSALAALVTLASPASARWYEGNNHYDNSWHGNDHYNGYYYRAPPVVYDRPYNSGYYYPPPVIYNNTPGFTIRLQ